MVLSLTAKFDSVKLQKFRRDFGESSNEALIRIAVAAGKEAAVLTEVKGKSKKKQIDSIITGARINVVSLDAKQFNRLAALRRPSFRFHNQWVTLDSSQLLRNQGEIHSFLEDNRDSRGRVKRLPPSRKAICKRADFNKVLVRRKRLAGIAKGSWLSAAKRAARFSRKSAQPPKVGKNFITWAQKHDLGTARFHSSILSRSFVLLISKASHTRYPSIFSRNSASVAIRRGWKKTVTWYRAAIRRGERG